MQAHPRRALYKSALIAVLALAGAVPHARAQGGCDDDGCSLPSAPSVPEINPADLISAAALLGGSAFVLCGRRRR